MSFIKYHIQELRGYFYIVDQYGAGITRHTTRVEASKVLREYQSRS